MAFRGRGRGRGRGGGGLIMAKKEPFILFPENVDLPDIAGVTEEKTLVYWNLRLQNYWKLSPYFLEEAESKKSQETDIERYSDRTKPKNRARRDPLSSHLKLTADHFPRELIQGAKRVPRDQKNVRWNPEADLQKLDIFEKLEQKYQNQDGKDVKEKKEGENEDEDNEQISEEEDEYSDDGDYNKNDDVDDDEDDYNMDEGGNDDEGVY